MRTVHFVLDFFPDERYMILLSARVNNRNVRLGKDGIITICLTEDDIKTLEKLPRLYKDVDNLNRKRTRLKYPHPLNANPTTS